MARVQILSSFPIMNLSIHGDHLAAANAQVHEIGNELKIRCENVMDTPFGAFVRWFALRPVRFARAWYCLGRDLFARARVSCSGCPSCVHDLWNGLRRHLRAVGNTSHAPVIISWVGASCVWVTHAHTHTHTGAHTHRHTHARTHTQAHTHTGTRTHAHTHTGTHTHRHTHAHTHTHTHTHTHMLMCKIKSSILNITHAKARTHTRARA